MRYQSVGAILIVAMVMFGAYVLLAASCANPAAPSTPAAPTPTPTPTPPTPTPTPITPPPGFTDNSVYTRPSYAPGQVYTTTSAVSSALSSASAGSVIVIKNGTYSNWALSTSESIDGTSSNPIVIMAETRGQVFIEGTSTFTLRGDYTILEGVVFRNGKPSSNTGAIIVEGNYCRVTNCEINGFNPSPATTDNKWISLKQSVYNRVDHCRFTGKASQGALFVVWRETATPNYHRIDHNVFKNFTYSIDAVGGTELNGWETIRLGDSAQSQSDSSSTIEYNYFYHCDGEGEMVSVKSGDNLIQYNTVIESRGAISLRHGYGCTVQYNFIRGNGLERTAGIRIMDRDHIVQYNYIEGITPKSGTKYTGGIVLMGAYAAPLVNEYWFVDNITVTKNTVVNSTLPLVYSGGSGTSFVYDKRPDRVTFTGNLVQNGVAGHSSSSSQLVNIMLGSGTWDLQRPTYSGNYFGGATLGLSSTPSGVSTGAVSLAQASGSQQYVWNGAGGAGAVGAPTLTKLAESDVGPSY